MRFGLNGILLQAAMGVPFMIFPLVAIFFVLIAAMGIFVGLFNYLQPKLFPKRPLRIGCFWILILPIVIIGIYIVLLFNSDFLMHS